MSCATEAEWALIAPFLPEPRRLGRPRTTDWRAVTDALLDSLSTGCQWRMLPKCFPPYSTVQRFFDRWRADGTWEHIKHELTMQARETEGRDASSTAGVIDSQSVKTTRAGGPRRYDPGKKIRGRMIATAPDVNSCVTKAIQGISNKPEKAKQWVR